MATKSVDMLRLHGSMGKGKEAPMAHLQAAGPAQEPPAERLSGRDRNHAPIVLDAVSRHIIDQLQQDGRRSYAAIGKAVGLSEPAVPKRAKRLLGSAAMQTAGVTDRMPLGSAGRP